MLTRWSKILLLGGVTFDSLSPGTYDVVAEWWWEGELLIRSTVDVTITG